MSSQTETTKKTIQDKRSSVERLASLESFIPTLIQMVGKRIEEMDEKVKPVSLMQEVIDAIITVVGLPAIEVALRDNRLLAMKEQAQDTKARTEKQKEEGILETDEVVSADSVVVIEETTPTNEVVGIGWFRFHVGEITPETQALFIGKKVGDSGEFPTGNTFKVLEVLKINPEKVRATVESTNVETV